MPSKRDKKERLLWPLPKSPMQSRQRSITKFSRNKWIDFQLRRDSRRRGPLTQATMLNHKSPLLRLPAELRNAIWELAIAPRYTLIDRHSIDIYDRFEAFFPEHTLLLVSRILYAEVLPMYAHAMKQLWAKSQFRFQLYHRFQSWDHQWDRLNTRFKSLPNEHLRHMSRFVLQGDNRSVPSLTYDHGTWQGTWTSPRTRRSEMRWVVLYGQLKVIKLKNLLKNMKHETLKLPVPWNDWLDALLLPTDMDESRYKAIRATAETETINKRNLKVMLALQWYTHGRYA